MHNRPPAPSRGSALWFTLGSLGIAVLVFAYLAATWHIFPSLHAAIDTCTQHFCDFTTFYYPMGKAILRTSTPVKGFMYSPFIALLLALFSPLTTNTALALWGILQASCVILYLGSFRWLVPARLRFQLLFVFIALTSFPLWHNLSWGQVGIFTTVAVLGALVLLERGHHISAAALFGLAASFKFFPLIFLAPFAFRRDFRFLLLAALACLACLVVIPAILIGPSNTLTFYRGLFDSFWASEWVVDNYNSQHFPHVLLRLAGKLGFAARPDLPLFSIVSFSLAAINLALVYRVQRAGLPYADLWSAHLLFLSIPFYLKTSWPVDLVYISFAQALLGWQILEREHPQLGARRKRLPHRVVLTLLVISIGLSNMAALDLVGSYRVFGFIGFIFWANLLCLIASYTLLLPCVLSPSKTSSDTLQQSTE